MSGIFGFVDTRAQNNTDDMLQRMGERMRHLPWHTVQTIAGASREVGLGRIGIGIFNREALPEPVDDVQVVLCGELYHADGIVADPAGAALDAYRAHGAGFASQLNGQFTIAVLDRRQQRLVLTNDRHGLYHHYVAALPGGLLFAPEVKALLLHPAVSREIDWTALAQIVRFQMLLGERTFFEGVQLLPPASVWEIDLRDGSCARRTYWSLEQVPSRPAIGFDEAVEEGARLLRSAVRRMSGDALRPGVFLSGGLDSRTLLGMIDRRPVASLTYGQPGARDVRLAARIARACGSTHHWVNMSDGAWVREQSALHLALTEGFHSWIHAHGMSTLPLARQIMDVNFSGWDGGTIMGHPGDWPTLHRPTVDDGAMLAEDFINYNQHLTWPGITESEERLLYTPPAWREIDGRAFESFRTEHARAAAYRPDVRRELFFVRQQCRRMTQYFVTFTRSHVECRLPFFDYDVFDFMYSLPVALRGRGRAWHAIVARATPKLSLIPDAYDERLPRPPGPLRNAHALTVSVRARLRKLAPGLFRPGSTLYADYESYLRNELRTWAEDILFDPRTAGRGIFDPGFLRSLMALHISGQQRHTVGKVAPLITYELMLRQFHD